MVESFESLAPFAPCNVTYTKKDGTALECIYIGCEQDEQLGITTNAGSSSSAAAASSNPQLGPGPNGVMLRRSEWIYAACAAAAQQDMSCIRCHTNSRIRQVSQCWAKQCPAMCATWRAGCSPQCMQAAASARQRMPSQCCSCTLSHSSSCTHLRHATSRHHAAVLLPAETLDVLVLTGLQLHGGSLSACTDPLTAAELDENSNSLLPLRHKGILHKAQGTLGPVSGNCSSTAAVDACSQ